MCNCDVIVSPFMMRSRLWLSFARVLRTERKCGDLCPEGLKNILDEFSEDILCSCPISKMTLGPTGFCHVSFRSYICKD